MSKIDQSAIEIRLDIAEQPKLHFRIIHPQRQACVSDEPLFGYV